MSSYCSNCGSKLKENAAFCEECGAAVIRKAQSFAQTGTPVMQAALPKGITMTADGTYQWVGECSIWKFSPFFKIMHIVSAVFAVLLCILVICIEAKDEGAGTIALHCLIAAAVMGVIDLLVCLFFAAKRAFRYKALFIVGPNGVSSTEQEAEAKNILTVIVQFIAVIASRGDVSHYMNIEYGRIREIIPRADMTMIRIKAGGLGGSLITTPEQHGFVLDLLGRYAGEKLIKR